jgi:hypothetical protein
LGASAAPRGGDGHVEQRRRGGGDRGRGKAPRAAAPARTRTRSPRRPARAAWTPRSGPITAPAAGGRDRRTGAQQHGGRDRHQVRAVGQRQGRAGMAADPAAARPRSRPSGPPPPTAGCRGAAPAARCQPPSVPGKSLAVISVTARRGASSAEPVSTRGCRRSYRCGGCWPGAVTAPTGVARCGRRPLRSRGFRVARGRPGPAAPEPGGRGCGRPTPPGRPPSSRRQATDLRKWPHREGSPDAVPHLRCTPGRHAAACALDVSRRASHADARSGRQGKGGGLDSSVRLAYTASLRCSLAVRLAFLPRNRDPGGPGTRAH